MQQQGVKKPTFLKSNSLQELTKDYDFYYKNFQDKIKILDSFNSILSQRLDIERNYQKQTQKLLGSNLFSYINDPEYGKIFQTIKKQIDFQLYISNERQDTEKQCLAQFQEVLKKKSDQVKKMNDAYKQVDRDTNNFFQKSKKLRDKFKGTARDLESTFIKQYCLDVNIEQNEKQKSQNQSRALNLLHDKEEVEEQFKYSLELHHNQSEKAIEETIKQNIELQIISDQMKYDLEKLIKKVLNKNTALNEEYSDIITQNNESLTNFCQTSHTEFNNLKVQNQQQKKETEYHLVIQWKPFKTFLTDYVDRLISEIDQPVITKKQSKKFQKTVEQQKMNMDCRTSIFDYFQTMVSMYDQSHFTTLCYIYDGMQKMDKDLIQQILNDTQGSYHQESKIEESQVRTVLQDDQEDSYMANPSMVSEAEEIQETEQIQQQQQQEQESKPKKEYSPEQILIFTKVNQKLEYLLKFYDEVTISHARIITTIIYFYCHPLNTQSISKEDFKLLQLLNQKQLYRDIATTTVQSFRNFQKKESQGQAFTNLQKLHEVLFNSCLRGKDSENGKLLMVMSCTLYIKNEADRVYLQEFIKHFNIWKCIDFWESVIYTSIKEDIDKQLPQRPKQYDQDQINKWLMQYKSLIQSNLFSVAVNMLKFKIQRDEVKNLLSKFAQQFGLFEVQTQEILKYIDDKGNIKGDGPSSISIMSNFYQHRVTEQEKYESQIQQQIQDGKSGEIKAKVFSFKGSSYK